MLFIDFELTRARARARTHTHTNGKERNRHIICIEDPFDVDVDLGRYVDEETCKDIVQVINFFLFVHTTTHTLR